MNRFVRSLIWLTICFVCLSLTCELSAANRVEFELVRYASPNYRLDQFADADYFIEVWIVTHEHEFEMLSFNLGIDYNTDVLGASTLEAYNEEEFGDIFITAAPEQSPPPKYARLNVLSGLNGYLIEANRRVWLATIRIPFAGPFDQIYLQGQEDDGVSVRVDDLVSVIFHGNVRLDARSH